MKEAIREVLSIPQELRREECATIGVFATLPAGSGVGVHEGILAGIEHDKVLVPPGEDRAEKDRVEEGRPEEGRDPPARIPWPLHGKCYNVRRVF